MNTRKTSPAGRANGLLCALGALAVATSIGVGAAQAQVPANIEAQLRKMGHIVDPICTARIYRPLQPKDDITSGKNPLYPGVSIARNQSFGPNPKDAVDIFWGDKGAASRTVLIYIPGGEGDKIDIRSKAGNAFYDNIGRWAVKNGMVEVNMQRHQGPEWDSGGKDVSAMIQWLQTNIAKYHGNPDHMVIWAQSAGNGPLGVYVGRPELWGPKGVGVVGAIFMSGQFDIAPLHPAGMGGRGGGGNLIAAMGKFCGVDATAHPYTGALPGMKPGEPGGPALPRAGGAGGGRQQIDEKTQLARSSLPEFEKTNVKIMLASAELDPGVDGAMSPFNQGLHDAMCKMGPSHCPTMLFEKDESHISEVFSIDTADTIVTGPILKFIQSIK